MESMVKIDGKMKKKDMTNQSEFKKIRDKINHMNQRMQEHQAANDRQN